MKERIIKGVFVSTLLLGATGTQLHWDLWDVTWSKPQSYST